ncbi:PLP-dependent transferase [uncultured Rikenella sp.]|uniref:PLP-dependent transferase n=1 Tax=uncultured Rikenella sp. TaxID=368003 RepID=UPI002619E8F9|nr:PLP-dependent transferase [uncultured Rikenella sp.]
MDGKPWGFTATVLAEPCDKSDPHGALSVPVYQNAAYEFSTAEAMELAFTGRSADHAYSRITNPTVEHFERRVRRATGALSVTALNSGMAAITHLFLTLGRAGANVVTSPHLFGNTYSLLRSTLADFGVETRFADMTDPGSVAALIDKDTCAVFLEIITNPQMEVADLAALSAVCRERGVPLAADTTIIPFHVFRARDFGVDIEIVSSTKYLSGGATGIGGLLIDYGTFDWGHSSKLAAAAKAYGVDMREAFTAKLRREIHRNLGAYMTPQVAYQQSLGLETLEVRYARASRTALEVARGLAGMRGVERVTYPGLPSDRFHEIAVRQFGAAPGAMLTFDLSSQQVCYAFMNRLRLIRRATNLFDNKSLAIHPWSTIFGTFPEAVRLSMDISPCTIRLSVGLEDAEDLLADIGQALSAASPERG